MSRKSEQTPETPECYFSKDRDAGSCGGDVEYCFGCKQLVCDEHSKNMNLPFGGHVPYDHLDEEDEEKHEE